MRFLSYFRLSESVGNVRKYNDKDKDKGKDKGNGYIDFGI